MSGQFETEMKMLDTIIESMNSRADQLAGPKRKQAAAICGILDNARATIGDAGTLLAHALEAPADTAPQKLSLIHI